MIKYRITKYNPIFRNEYGYYNQDYDDWTSLYDVGKVFKDNIFTFEMYLNIENKYVNAIKILLSKLKVEHLRVINLSEINYEKSKTILSEIDMNTKLIFEKIKNIKEDEIINLELIQYFIIANLRELCYCELFHKKVIINFGYDLYMYVYLLEKLESAINDISLSGLFPENLGNIAFDNPRRIIVSSKKESEVLNDLSIDLSFIGIEKLRKIFNFSYEHPMNNIYKINLDVAERLEKIINYKFALEEYDYYLEADTDL